MNSANSEKRSEEAEAEERTALRYIIKPLTEVREKRTQQLHSCATKLKKHPANNPAITLVR